MKPDLAIKKIKGRGAQLRIPNRFSSRAVETEVNDLPTQTEREELLFPRPETKLVEVQPKTILNKMESPDLPLDWSMNPYQGCEHGCIYCYARNSHEYWDGGAGLEFETQILVKLQAPRLLRDALSNPKWKVSPVVLSGNTDCYQPAEAKLQITRKCLEVFAEFHHPVGIITKNSLILRDLDLLQQLAQNDLVHVNISLNTLDEDLKRVMEPRSSSVNRMLHTIKILSSNGIPVRVLIAPIIPGLNDTDIMDIVKLAAENGAGGVTYQVVRLNGHVGVLFEDWIKKTFPDRAEKVLNRIKSLHGGKLNDSRFGKRMRGEGQWAEIIRQQFKLAKDRYLPEETIPAFNLDLFDQHRPGQLGLF
ncbi:MAG: PA0069 family radical SAM protein [Bacteroidetes bacterium]|nr:PA0069 family radical SAM protein [Bacteroidota bacterium]